MGGDGFSFNQKVDYEWKPKICSKCGSYDHVDSSCPIRQEWQVAQTSPRPMKTSFFVYRPLYFCQWAKQRHTRPFLCIHPPDPSGFTNKCSNIHWTQQEALTPLCHENQNAWNMVVQIKSTRTHKVPPRVLKVYSKSHRKSSRILKSKVTADNMGDKPPGFSMTSLGT